MKKYTFIILLSSILFASPVYSSAINAEADAFYNKAEAAFKNKDLVTAEKDLIEALKLEPDNANYRYILAVVQLMRNNFLESKNNMEIVSHSRPIEEKGPDYNNKLKGYKKKIKDMQSKFNEAGQSRFDIYDKNKNSPQKLKLAVTAYQAFRLNPPLRYKNIKVLEEITGIYEENLQKSFDGSEWQKEPMLQLAFLYEIANKKDKAAEVYMRALDYIEDPNEEFVITHKFDYLNRSNKEKLLDTIEAGDFTRADIEELIGAEAKEIDEEDKKKYESMLDEAQAKLQDAGSQEAREQVLEDIKKSILDKQKRGELPGQDKIKERLEKEGKTMDDYLKEKGF